MADGRRVATVEGLANGAELDPVQQGFVACHGLQCGFCTPGMMMTARCAARPQPGSDRDGDPRGDLRPDVPVHRLREHRPVVRWAAEHEADRGRQRRRRWPHDRHRISAAATPMGFGRMARKEDVRFTRGHGNYVDDVQLPGMLHGAILRSPFAHARIVSIDTKAAEAHPKVKAVITGAVLETLGLAWMPTLSYDTQAVLATDKVRFQGQEVAFVVAEDRYSARDALELIDVEYEVLPAVVDARKALDADAAGDPRRQGGQDRQPHLRLGGRRQGEDRRGVRRTPTSWCSRTSSTRACTRRRWRPAARSPTWTRSPASSRCGATRRRRTRTARVYALVAGLPEQKIRVISPDIGGGFGNKVPIYPGYVLRDRRLHRHRQAGEVGGGPVGEPDVAPASPATTTCTPRSRRRRDGKIQAVRVNVLADHGAFNATAQPTKFPAGFFHVFSGSLRPRGRALRGQGRLHEQGAGRRRVRVLVPGDRGGVPHRADGRRARLRAEDGPGRAADAEPAAARAVPVPHARPAGSTTPATTRGRCSWPWTWPATTSCAPSRPSSGEVAAGERGGC